MPTLNTMLNSANSNLKELLKKASKVTIKTEQSVVVLTLQGNEIITEVYESASLRKAGFHAIGSIKELCLVFEELGLCLFQIVKKLMVLKLFNRAKPLLIEYKLTNSSRTPSS